MTPRRSVRIGRLSAGRHVDCDWARAYGINYLVRGRGSRAVRWGQLSTSVWMTNTVGIRRDKQKSKKSNELTCDVCPRPRVRCPGIRSAMGLGYGVNRVSSKEEERAAAGEPSHARGWVGSRCSSSSALTLPADSEEKRGMG